MTAATADIGEFPPYIAGHQTERDRRYQHELREYFHSSLGDTLDKLRNFPKFLPRSELGKFLAKNEIFRRILGVHGHVIECGVHLGGGFLTWAQLSAIYEPLNHVRRIVGFDTFRGFVTIHEHDAGDNAGLAVPGALAAAAREDLEQGCRVFDLGRPIGHIPRTELVEGDACETIPRYLEANRHLVVALLYLDFDLYEPTRVAIETFLPRMPKGAVLAFDELNLKQWPGETQAVVDSIGLRNLRIERFCYQPQISFAVLE